jgi:MFS family permease
MHSYEGLDRAGGLARDNLTAPFKLRSFRLLWTAMAISLLGDGVFIVALAWQTYQLSELPSSLAVVSLAITIPHVCLLLFGGVASDRFPRARVMLASDLVRGAAIALVAWLSITDHLSLSSLIWLTALYGAGSAFFGPAFDAIVPELVPKRLLPQANSLDQLIKPLALRLAGPALGGLLIGAFGVGWALAFDAATFFISIGALLAIGVQSLPARSSRSFVSDLCSGFSFVKSNIWLWGTFGAAAIAYLLFMGPAEVLLPYIVKVEMGREAFDLGLIFAMGGVGSILAAVIVGSRSLPRRKITFIYTAWTLSTLAVAGYGMARLPWQLMIASFAFNALETAGTIVWVTLKQRMVPSDLLGRVSSLDWLISIGLLPLSFALTGYASQALGARTVLVGAGVIGAAVTLGALFLPGMREVEGEPVTEPRLPREAVPVES